MHQLEFPPEEPLRLELRAFIESIQTRQAPIADAWAGYEAVRVLEAALKSARTGQTVDLAAEGNQVVCLAPEAASTLRRN